MKPTSLQGDSGFASDINARPSIKAVGAADVGIEHPPAPTNEAVPPVIYRGGGGGCASHRERDEVPSDRSTH